MVFHSLDIQCGSFNMAFNSLDIQCGSLDTKRHSLGTVCYLHDKLSDSLKTGSDAPFFKIIKKIKNTMLV